MYCLLVGVATDSERNYSFSKATHRTLVLGSNKNLFWDWATVQLGEETWILHWTQFGLQAMRLDAYVHHGLPSISLLWKPSISVFLTNSKSVESAMRLSTTLVLLNLS